MGLLHKTKVYCIGHMQYKDGSAWREYVREELTPLGITVFDPYDKPFIKDVDESKEAFELAYQQLQDGDFDAVTDRMKMIRAYDLSLVDRSDFIIGHIDSDVPTFGTIEELVVATKCKRPIFLSFENSIQSCPLWVFGMLPHKYFYDSIEDVITMIKSIDDGSQKIDSSRWRLLREEYR
jgi:hypothetical protein